MGANRIALNPFLMAVAGVLALEGGAWALVGTGGRLAGATTLAVLGLLRIGQLGWLLMIFGGRQSGWESLGLSPIRLAGGLRQGLLWAAGLGAAAMLAGVLMTSLGVSPWRYFHLKLPAGGAGLLLYLGVGGIVAPAAEELFFRGVLYGYFRRWGWPAALALSTACFVLAHGWPQNPPITQLVGGLVFAAAYETSGSLAAPMVVHILGNLAIFFIALLV